MAGLIGPWGEGGGGNHQARSGALTTSAAVMGVCVRIGTWEKASRVGACVVKRPSDQAEADFGRASDERVGWSALWSDHRANNP